MPTLMSTLHRTPRAAGLAGAVLLSLGLAGPGRAQTTNPPAAPVPTPMTAPQTAPPAATQAATMTPAPINTPSGAATAAGDAAGPLSQADLQSTVGRDKAAKIESHITKLHGDLKITATQEPAWQAFAGMMRRNAAQMDAAYGKRQQSYGSMNAVQDLESYVAFEQASAESIAPLLPPFRTLYDGLSAQQKQSADAIFKRHIDKAVKKPG
jgi:protein CpxP